MNQSEINFNRLVIHTGHNLTVLNSHKRVGQIEDSECTRIEGYYLETTVRLFCRSCNLEVTSETKRDPIYLERAIRYWPEFAVTDQDREDYKQLQALLGEPA